MQEVGAGELPREAMVGRGDTGKSPSVAAGEVEAQGHHGARPSQMGRSGGRQESQAGETLVVRGDDGGCQASEVAHKSSGVEDKEGGRKASGVVENPHG